MKTAPGTILTRDSVFNLIQQDLAKVESELKRNSESGVHLVRNINSYLQDSGGKRLRPSLLLLTSRLCGFEEESAIRVSTVVELIHLATLVHDDIIDNGRTRRGRPSVNALWGNQITVLMGDWLYMTSFQLALELRKFRVLDVLIDVTRQMVEGELMQLEQNGRLDISAEEHLEVCLRKTAYLFSGCGKLGAILGEAGPEAEDYLSRYGRAVGMAFQLIDDLLDYTSREEVLGKPVLKDLEEGKITLPMIYLMQRADDSERAFVSKMLQTKDFSAGNKNRILSLVRAYETLPELMELACRYAAEAKLCLTHFPDSIYREALLRIPDLVVNRKR
jgi:octaprenyl-diphosphate synthase